MLNQSRFVGYVIATKFVTISFDVLSHHIQIQIQGGSLFLLNKQILNQSNQNYLVRVGLRLIVYLSFHQSFYLNLFITKTFILKLKTPRLIGASFYPGLDFAIAPCFAEPGFPISICTHTHMPLHMSKQNKIKQQQKQVDTPTNLRRNKHCFLASYRQRFSICCATPHCGSVFL